MSPAGPDSPGGWRIGRPARRSSPEHARIGNTERAGRAQDKEDLMERLRDLGYM